MPAKKAKTKSKKAASGLDKMPTPKQLEKMKEKDSGFILARQDAVKFLYSRRQAIYNIARGYRLDPEELLQEGYEVLLTCMRDYTPVYEKADGDIVSVQFTTFFGSRMDGRAMEMRNRDPEYQARQAYTSDMSVEEKERFKSDPPLLVQHLDQETSVQEALRSEASAAQESLSGDAAFQVMRDSFFEAKLNELVAKEKDDKKRAILMQVKVGGVFNFQEMAYHFGVTDSRASQILNELMDAFYIQRLIDGDLESVAYDFTKLKFNEKRVLRLVKESFQHISAERYTAMTEEFKDVFPSVLELPKPNIVQALPAGEGSAGEEDGETLQVMPASQQASEFEDTFTKEENKKYPSAGVEIRKIDNLMPVLCEFRAPEERGKIPNYIGSIFEQNQAAWPIIVTEAGQVIDGARRLLEAKKRGLTELTCMVRKVPDEHAAKVLRVSLNLRTGKADKIDIYWAIVALGELGLSQQKIANALGISRTNVIVYAKVKDKASPVLRKLFEDGLIQITNASTCVDLSERIQERLAAFVRTYGSQWGKGSQFSELYEAASGGKLAQLEKKMAATQTPVATVPEVTVAEGQVPANIVESFDHLNKQVAAYQQALKDSEVWTAQRESVINRQTEELTAAQTEIETLKKELEAAELIHYGDEEAIQAVLKELRQYHAIIERVTGSIQHVKYVSKQVRSLNLTRKQMLEMRELVEELEQGITTLRVEIKQKNDKPKGLSITEKPQN